MKIYSRAIWTLFFGIIGNGYLLAQTKVIINESILGKQIDDSFVGFSFNPAYSSQYFSTNYNGSNTRAISVQLFENFKNLQKPSVRIIGANNSYWRNASNFPNAPQNWNNNPNDIPLNYFPTTTPVFSTVIDQTDLDNFQGFFSSLSFAVPCILGINSSVIDKNRTIDMAKVSKSTLISPSSLEFEIGNEPDAFISNSRRLNGYGLTQYLQEYNYLADAIKNYGQAAAPALAKTNTGSWVDDIGNFLDQGTNLSTLTYHDYPLGNNNISTNTTSYLNKFLLDKYTKGVADGIITSINAASQKNKKLRMGEINTIAAGGNYGSSNSFGAALWVIDLMYELAKGGASGVNIATEGGSKTCYSPFEYRSDLLKSGNKVWVRPIYYGMLMFARAVPNSSKLLPVNFTTTVNPDQIKIWATKDKNQNTRIMLINRGTSINDQSITPIEISLDKRIQAAKYTLLEANGGIADTSNVTLGGQKIDLNSGEIKAANNLIISPENIGNTSTYKIDLKAGTAVLLEILANQNPTDILLSNNSIAENVPANTLIGTLSTIDQDLNDTFTYTLVAGQGDANNNDFSINENQLKIKNSPNFEGKNTYSVRLRATDFAGAFTEKVFSIQITDLNEAPTDITLSNNSIAENVPANTLIGTFSGIDQDVNDSFSYQLVAGAGDRDNSSFNLSGDALKINISPDFENQREYNIRVRIRDKSGLGMEKMFVINIIDVLETPPPFSLPANNFTIAITSETCRKNNDGKIKISAIQNLNYKLSLSHKGKIDVYSFNSIQEIINLEAGNYEACIIIEGKVDYKQCFNLVITEPQDLSVYSSININTNILSLSLSGANNYTITLNNQISKINSNKAEFALKEGRNELLVTSDKPCQGSIFRTIYYNSQVLVYPNPFNNSLKIELNEEKQISKIVVMDLNGKVFYQKHTPNGFFEHSLDLDLSFLPEGLYMLKLSGNNLETAQKILKQ